MERRRPRTPPDDLLGLAPTRVQTKTVCVAPDEVETVHDRTSKHAALDDIKAYLKANGIADEGTALGDMVMVGALAPRVLPAPTPPPAVLPRSESMESKTVHAYCEPLLPFLPVEDLAAPKEASDPEPELLYEPQPLPDSAIISHKVDDPILEYLREVSADFAPPVEPTAFHMPNGDLPLVIPVRTPPPKQIAPQPMSPDPTLHEQAAVKTSCIRHRRPQKSNFSARVLAVKKRRTPMWAAALMGALIAALLLTSSVFTVEVLASKLSSKSAANVEAPATPETPATPERPWVVPR